MVEGKRVPLGVLEREKVELVEVRSSTVGLRALRLITEIRESLVVNGAQASQSK